MIIMTVMILIRKVGMMILLVEILMKMVVLKVNLMRVVILIMMVVVIAFLIMKMMLVITMMVMVTRWICSNKYVGLDNANAGDSENNVDAGNMYSGAGKIMMVVEMMILVELILMKVMMLTVVMVLAQILVGTNANTTIKIGDFDINNARCKKRLRVKFDHRLIFDDQVSDLCHKASCKIHALARIAPQMNLKKRRLMMNTFFTSQFNNCSLIGLFHSQKKTKTKSTDLARVVLQKICHDKQLSFEQLLEKDGSVFVNEKYFHKIGAEIYKVSKVL